jgi:hypothetical protein
MGSGGIAPPLLTSALDGGEWSPSRPGHFTSEETVPPVPIGQEAGWAPEPVWTLWSREKSFDSAGYQTSAVRPVPRRYTD